MDKKLLDRIMKKIEWAPEGECIVWKGAVVNGHPVLRDDKKLLMVRRLLTGVAEGERLYVGCGNGRCVNVEHLVTPTRKLDLKNKLEKKGIQPSEEEFRAYVRAAGDAYREGKNLEEFKVEYFKQKGWSL